MQGENLEKIVWSTSVKLYSELISVKNNTNLLFMCERVNQFLITERIH